ncbi:MAG: hypothetical protein U0271_15310 [Polyangiaceae bacterium]
MPIQPAPIVERDANTTRIRVQSGSIELTSSRGVVLAKYRGRLTGACAARYIEALERVVGRGPIETFNDARDLVGYEPDFRVQLVDFLRSKQDAIPRTHVLASGKIVAMTVSVVSLLLGRDRVEAYNDPVAFEGAMTAYRQRRAMLDGREDCG